MTEFEWKIDRSFAELLAVASTDSTHTQGKIVLCYTMLYNVIYDRHIYGRNTDLHQVGWYDLHCRECDCSCVYGNTDVRRLKQVKPADS